MIGWAAALFAVLLGLELWASPALYAHVSKPYADLTMHAIGVAFILAFVFLIDRLIRRFYWHGYLKRRHGRDTPALIQDIVTIALLALGLSTGLSVEAGFSVTGIATASGATAIILGIALQAVIQDLFSGLAINLDGSYAIGEWLTIYSDQMPEPIYGRVIGITWRSTFLMLDDGRMLMVPNRMVTSNPVMNHSRPREAKRLSVELSIDNRVPHDRVTDMLLGEAFKAVRNPGLARYPEPTVLLTRLDSDATFYEVRFYYHLDQIEPSAAKSVVFKALLSVVQQNALPAPVTQIELAQPPNLDFLFGEKEERDAINRVPLFEGILRPEHVDILVARCTPAELPTGTVLMNQGDAGSSMFIILEGAAGVTIRSDTGQSHEVAILATGDLVGEMSLMTGAPRNATVTALTRMRVLEVTKDAIETILQQAPELAERFSRVLAERQQQNEELTHRLTRREAVQSALLARIMTFFSHAFGNK